MNTSTAPHHNERMNFAMAKDKPIKFGSRYNYRSVPRRPYRKHGMSRSPEYRAWQAILHRCLNPLSQAFHNYGGRGITVCKEWMAFENFLLDVGPRPSQGYSIERINNNKGYYPDNVKWIPSRDQGKNRRTSKWITFNGKTQIMEDWEREMGFKRHIILERLERGWSVNKAITTPVRSSHKSVTFNGQTKTLSEWSKEVNIKNAEIWRRLNRGWSVEEALTVPVRKPSSQKL